MWTPKAPDEDGYWSQMGDTGLIQFVNGLIQLLFNQKGFHHFPLQSNFPTAGLLQEEPISGGKEHGTEQNLSEISRGKSLPVIF